MTTMKSPWRSTSNNTLASPLRSRQRECSWSTVESSAFSTWIRMRRDFGSGTLAYRKLQEKVKLQVPVLIRGGVRIEEDANPKLTVNDIIPLEEAKVPLPKS